MPGRCDFQQVAVRCSLGSVTILTTLESRWRAAHDRRRLPTGCGQGRASSTNSRWPIRPAVWPTLVCWRVLVVFQLFLIFFCGLLRCVCFNLSRRFDGCRNHGLTLRRLFCDCRMCGGRRRLDGRCCSFGRWRTGLRVRGSRRGRSFGLRWRRGFYSGLLGRRMWHSSRSCLRGCWHRMSLCRLRMWLRLDSLSGR